MTNKELHYFIGNCLAINNENGLKDRLEQIIQRKQIDWNKFVWICSNNLVLQTVYVKFKTHGLLELLPSDLVFHLEEIYKLNLNQNMQILNQIDEISQIFETKNIQPVYLKGAGNLIDNLYKNPGERILSDIDLLVREDQFTIAVECLESIGYKSKVQNYEVYSELMHFPEMHREDLPVPVEIHRHPVSKPWLRRLSSENVLSDSIKIAGKKNQYVPSNLHKTTINFIHSQLSNKGSITSLVSFRDMYDIFLLSQRFDLKTRLNEIPFKRRAKSYFHLINVLFNLTGNERSSRTFSNRIFMMHYNLNLSSRLYYNTYRIARSFIELLIIDYLWKVPGFFFSKRMRKTVLLKLRSREWYKGHLKSMKGRFT